MIATTKMSYSDKGFQRYQNITQFHFFLTKSLNKACILTLINKLQFEEKPIKILIFGIAPVTRSITALICSQISRISWKILKEVTNSSRQMKDFMQVQRLPVAGMLTGRDWI